MKPDPRLRPPSFTPLPTMPRLTASFFFALTASLLAGCASQTPGAGLSDAGLPSAVPTASRALPAATALASASAASAPSDAASAAAPAADARSEPIVIRGDDRVVATHKVPGPPAKGMVSSFKFEDAPIGEVANVMLNDLLKVSYVVHPPLNGKVTLITRGPVDADKAMLLLEQALQSNGIVLARDSRGTYHVGSPEALRGIVSAPQMLGAGSIPPGYGTVIISPQYVGAAEIANILRPLVAPEAIVRVDTLRNILVMRGTRVEAEGWLELVKTFDVNLLRGMSVGVFPLKHTSAADAEAALRLISGGAAGSTGAQAGRATNVRAQGAAGSPTGPGGVSPFGAASASPAGAAGLGESNPLYGALRIMPIERINALLVVTPRAAYLDEVRYWIEQFDRPNLNSAEPQLFVYKVQNGSADHLAELLNGIYGGGVLTQPGANGATGVAPGLTSLSGATNGLSTNLNGGFASNVNTLNSSSGGTSRMGLSSFGGGASTTGATALGGTAGSSNGQQGPGVTTTMLGQSVRVMADRINNTLLVHATPAEYERIEGTLKRLDIQRAQVLIEATIVEVQLSDGLQYGLQWAFSGGLGGGRRGSGILNNGTTGLSFADGTRSYDLGSAAATGFSYAVSNSAGAVTAMLNTLANKNLVKVISSPSLMVLDNHTAAISVGQQQPVQTGSTTVNTSTNYTTTTIQYKDTGVMLGVTPSVSAGDLVTLDINQIVTDVVNPTAATPTFTQRQIVSKVAVRSGETLVLGGLIKDNSSNGKSGLPFLSSIPVVGALFGQHTQSSDRTELLVVFTPRVLRSDEDARAVSRELRERMRALDLSSPPAGVPASAKP